MLWASHTPREEMMYSSVAPRSRSPTRLAFVDSFSVRVLEWNVRFQEPQLEVQYQSVQRQCGVQLRVRRVWGCSTCISLFFANMRSSFTAVFEAMRLLNSEADLFKVLMPALWSTSPLQNSFLWPLSSCSFLKHALFWEIWYSRHVLVNANVYLKN